MALLNGRILISTWLTILIPILIGDDVGMILTSAQSSCHQSNVTCIPLSGPGTAPPTCYGASLKFSYTSLLWANDSSSLADVTSRLKVWEGLSRVPECWAVVQPFLCSVYIPKCDKDNGRVEYPSLELCEKTREPCKVVRQFARDWPHFLRCSQPYFKQNCGTGAYDQLNYNTTGQCQAPLVRTTKEASWWAGLEGCGLQCNNPLYSDTQHQHAHLFVAVAGAVCLLCILFTIFTFLIDWENASRYPAIILFFINICFLMATVGWMAQFSEGAREDIVCRVDGTARKTEPQLGSGETASCTVVFVMVYYFTMAAMLWFVMLCYAWHVTFRALGTARDDLSSKTAYFHLVSWSIPLVLTIVCLAISEIDGDSISGICFVGYNNHSVRAGFLLVPVASVLIVGLFFLVKGLMTLVRISKDVPECAGEKAASKIHETIVRIGVFSALALTFGIVTFSIHIYVFVYESQWSASLNEHLNCITNMTVSRSAGSTGGPDSCSLNNRPSLVAALCNIFTFFGTAIIMSSWSWTKASLYAWERFLRKAFKKQSSDEPLGEEQHQMIPRPRHRYHETNNPRHSFSFHNPHEDPLGMKFDLHSMSSNLSRLTSVTHNMQHMVHPHTGLVHPAAAAAAAALRRCSDSDIASVMSRRLSQGSQHPHDLKGAGGQYIYMERDNSSNNGSDLGGWRRRRRRRKRRKRRKKRNIVQPILGPLLSGVGLGSIKASRRASESSVLSRASGGQDGTLPADHDRPVFRAGGSSSSLPGHERHLGGAGLSASEVRGHAGRSRRRKLPRLAPLSRHRHRSLSSSRSSMSQFGMGMGGLHAFSPPPQPQHYPHAMYPPMYGGYDYAQFYASLGYPQMAYPYWPPYPYPQYPPHPPSSTGQATDFSFNPNPTPTANTSANTTTNANTNTNTNNTNSKNNTNNSSVPGGVPSSPEMERKRVVTASTSRRSEVTIETQQTETISLQTMKTVPPDPKKTQAPVSDDDDSEEDLNSSELEDSAAEDMGTDNDTAGEAEDEV